MSSTKQGEVPVTAPTPRPPSGLAVVDINTFFRILRFISSYPGLAKVPSAAVDDPQPVRSEEAVGSRRDSSVLAASLASSSSSLSVSVPPHVAAAAPPAVTGVSLSVANRILLPPRLREPLEQYRRVAVTPPIDSTNLQAARQQVQAILQGLCAELKDAAATAALEKDVFAHTEDEFVESDSTGLVASAAASAVGPRFDDTHTRISNVQEMQQIVPGLWCGPQGVATNRAVLKKYGITHIFCCLQSGPAFADDFMWCNIPAEDRPQFNIAQHFSRAFEFIENALVKQHGNVLVHCEYAISRGPTIVAAYLMRKLRICSTAAIQLVRHSRYAASPNTGFRDQLHKYGLSLNVDEKEASERAAVANAEFKEVTAHINVRDQGKTKSAEAAKK